MNEQDIKKADFRKTASQCGGAVGPSQLRDALLQFDGDVQARADSLSIAAQPQISPTVIPTPPPGISLPMIPFPLDPNPLPNNNENSGGGGNQGILVVTTGILNGVVATCNFYSDADPVPL